MLNRHKENSRLNKTVRVETNKFKNGSINNTAIPHASLSATFNKYFDWSVHALLRPQFFLCITTDTRIFFLLFNLKQDLHQHIGSLHRSHEHSHYIFLAWRI